MHPLPAGVSKVAIGISRDSIGCAMEVAPPSEPPGQPWDSLGKLTALGRDGTETD